MEQHNSTKVRTLTEPPKALRTARMVMFGQSGLSIVMGLVLLTLFSSFDAGDSGGMVLILVLSLLLSVALLVCAATLPRRQPGVRITAIALESVNILSAVIGEILLFLSDDAPNPTAVVPFVLSALVIRSLLQPEVRAWFADEHTPVR